MTSLTLIAVLALTGSSMVESQSLDDSVPRSDDEASLPGSDGEASLPPSDDEASLPASDNEDYPPKSTADDPAKESPADGTPAPAHDPAKGSPAAGTPAPAGVGQGNGGRLSEYIFTKDALFNSVYKAGSRTSDPAKCALDCSENPECQAFTLYQNQLCLLHHMRPCMAPSSSVIKTAKMYEKKANVTVGKKYAFTLIAKFRCGKMIKQKNATISLTYPNSLDDTLAKHATMCSQSCVKQNPKCASYMFNSMLKEAKNGTEQIQTTCSWYEDSIYTVPVHGLYQICFPPVKNGTYYWYGIQGQIPSVANCGQMITAVA